ncbi:hypothetical protein KI688_004863 [Linnemannia hyalina]|uniref:Uncharacterized protein n=1 Tax=Linnemannia hyalina TaxID=64524 RepID=A0A9P7XM55_9FUNG|nr:hypothetical protein KI688_004863 [Linnemannia hyalina]
MAYVGRNNKYGKLNVQNKPNVDQCRKEFHVLLLEGSLSLSRVSASELVNSSILDHTEQAMRLRQESKCSASSTSGGTVPSIPTSHNANEISKDANVHNAATERSNGGSSIPVLLKRGRTRKPDTASKTARYGKSNSNAGFTPEVFLGGNYQPPEYNVEDGTRTPPRGVQGHNEDIPLVEE